MLSETVTLNWNDLFEFILYSLLVFPKIIKVQCKYLYLSLFYYLFSRSRPYYIMYIEKKYIMIERYTNKVKLEIELKH